MKTWRPNLPPHATFKAATYRRAAKTSSLVYQLGESPILRHVSKELDVKKITSKETQDKLGYLEKTFLKYRELTGYGRGLCAVQIGILERFSIVLKGKTTMFIINPKVTKESKKRYKYPEMCMSLDPLIVPVVRPAWIEFEYHDEKGTLKKWTMKDDTKTGRMMNRLFQHEIDHMDGVFNIDRATSLKEIIMEADPEFYQRAVFEEIKR